ncbi:MAG: adenylate cyclase [Thermoleophilaceae bacterium]|nr:adenylate cyclase [Thermoleophilaceae bacterium]MEA2471997.1 adenylate cyclase [Thermoleophilaceae bacterium]
MRRRVLHVAVALVAVLLALGARAGDVLQPLELNTVDARFTIRGHHDPRAGIAVVALDGRTLSELGLRPPLPRLLHARVIDRLRAAHAKLIAYDIQFIGPARPAAQDRALIAAIRRAHPVLATHDVQGPPLVVPAGVPVPEATLASVGLLADPDGKVRREPYTGVQHRSFELEVSERLLGRRVDPGRFPAWIDYAGPPRTYPTYALVDVLRGRVPGSAFAGKLVVVGSSDPIEKDVFPTPVSSVQMPGAEIHANGIATILAGFPLRSVPAGLDTLLIVLLGLAPPLLSLRLGALKMLALAAALLIGYLVAAQLAFDGGDIVLVTYPLLGLVLSSSGSATVEFLTTTRERQRLRRNFARFVPAAVVDDVMRRTDDDLRLGGITIDSTVLFCDLRGFTRWAEPQPAATVIETLNRYLTEMSDALLAHGGTVVSYMGDGIMAVFGAPIEQADHADRALGAAREMLHVRLPRFNASLPEGQAFRMGIGLNSGPVSSGNVGSEERLEYAAVGDTTNVAARLEAKCKETPHQLLFSDATRERLVGDPEDLVDLGKLDIRGREATIRVWALQGAGGGEPTTPP